MYIPILAHTNTIVKYFLEVEENTVLNKYITSSL